MDEIIGTFDLQRNMWVVEFYSLNEMWAELTLDKRSAVYHLTIFGAPDEGVLAIDLHDAVHHLREAKRRILTGTISDIRTEEESGNFDWRMSDPFEDRIKTGSPARVVISSDDQTGAFIAKIYGGDDHWATLSLDVDTGEYTLHILARVATEKWLGLDLDETLGTIFTAETMLMKRQVFGIE